MNCKFADTNPSAWQACLTWNTGGQCVAEVQIAARLYYGITLLAKQEL